jgi:hypothetical protein
MKIHIYGNIIFLRVKEKRSILYKKKRRKVNWIGHILPRNCPLKQVVEGNVERMIEVTGKRRRRRKHVLDGVKEMNGYRKLKEEALNGLKMF